jgi:hypothetical protein
MGSTRSKDCVVLVKLDGWNWAPCVRYGTAGDSEWGGCVDAHVSWSAMGDQPVENAERYALAILRACALAKQGAVVCEVQREQNGKVVRARRRR